MTVQSIERVETMPSLAIRDREEIDVQVATAQKYPRDLAVFESGVLAAVQNPEFAGTCTYLLKRAGKEIIGPSIRFAECVRQNFKHLAIGTRVIGEEEKYVLIEARGIDFQTNNRDQCEVRRRITDRDGNRYNDDMITNTIMAAQAIGRRNLVLSLTSKALWGPLWEEAQRVTAGRKRVDGKTVEPTPAKVLELREKAIAFLRERWQITEAQVCKILDVDDTGQIGPDQIVILRALATALHDGDMTVDEALRHSKPIPRMPQPKKGKKKAKMGRSPNLHKGEDPGIAVTFTTKTITENQYRDLVAWLRDQKLDVEHAAKCARALGHKAALKDFPIAQLPKLYEMLRPK